MKIGVMGAGGLGGYIGGRLAQGGHDAAFIARGQHLRAMRETGLSVQSPLGDFTIESPHATDDPAQVGTVELIIFSVKSYDAPEAIETMKPMVGPGTVVLPVLNGVTHIEQLSDQLGNEHTLGGMANLGANIAEPGLIRHIAHLDSIEFGEIGGGISQRCKNIQNALTQQGIEFKAVPNIIERMWFKYAGFCPAGLYAVMRGDVGLMFAFDELVELYYAVYREVVAVAGAKGIFVPPPPTVDEARELYKSLPLDYKPSIALDLESGKRLELEALNGALSRYGKELGVTTPVNDCIYACLKPYANGRPE